MDAVKPEGANTFAGSATVPRPFEFGTILRAFQVSDGVATGTLVVDSRTVFGVVTKRVSLHASTVVCRLRGVRFRLPRMSHLLCRRRALRWLRTAVVRRRVAAALLHVGLNTLLVCTWLSTSGLDTFRVK